jgi:hypothetical protein
MAPQQIAKPDADKSQTLEARIRMRAYQRYLERGSLPGFELDDWFQAQEEVLALEEQQSYLEP